MSCNAGEEQRLGELFSYVETHVTALTAEFGQVGEDRLMLMAALRVADELWDLRDELEENAKRAQNELRKIAEREVKANSSSASDNKLDDATSDRAVDPGGSGERGTGNNPKGSNPPSTGEMDIGASLGTPRPEKRAYR